MSFLKTATLAALLSTYASYAYPEKMLQNGLFADSRTEGGRYFSWFAQGESLSDRISASELQYLKEALKHDAGPEIEFVILVASNSALDGGKIVPDYAPFASNLQISTIQNLITHGSNCSFALFTVSATGAKPADVLLMITEESLALDNQKDRVVLCINEALGAE